MASLKGDVERARALLDSLDEGDVDRCVSIYMCFYLDVYVCVAPTFAGIVFAFVLYLDEYVYCKCSIGLCRPGFGEVTALHIAVLRGHLPLVSLLTSAGGHLVLVLLLFLVLAI